jgi:hypothetical protein
VAHPQNPAEIGFQNYCDEVGLDLDFEPDWNAEFNNVFRKNPDFLARTSLAVIEVREFQTKAKSNFLTENSSWNGPIPPTVWRKPLYYAIKEKAHQLKEFSATGVPLIIVLANPRGAEVNLESSVLVSTMFGEPMDPASDFRGVESAIGATRTFHKPGYGVFCGTDSKGQPRNRRPHISGIAVLEEGISYFDLAGYWLGSGPPVPDNWFTGLCDRRFGFEDGGGCLRPRLAVSQRAPSRG